MESTRLGPPITAALCVLSAALTLSLGTLLSCAGSKANGTGTSRANMSFDSTPPDAEKRPKELVAHGHTRIDDYYWMNERDSPDVIAYLEAENRYSASVLESTKPEQKTLFDEFLGRVQEDDDSVPVTRGEYAYFTRTREGQAYPIHCRIRSSTFREKGMAALDDADAVEVLFDVNKLSRGHGFYAIGTRTPSPDHGRIAYAVDTVGRRLYDIEIKNLVRGDVERGISNTTGNIVWAEDGRTLFYVKREPDTLRGFQVWKHVLDTSAASDELVYEESDPEFSCYVTKTRSKRFLMIVSRQTLSTEVRVCEAATPSAGFRVVIPRERGHEYSVDHRGDRFLIRTNKAAENFRLVSAPVDDPSEWKEELRHRSDRLLEGVEAFDGYIVTTEREAGLVHIVVRPDAVEPYEIQFDDPAYSTGTSGNAEYSTDKIRYRYSSLTTPPSVFEFDVSTGESTLVKQAQVGGDFDKRNYVSRRVFAEADDGAFVPLSIVSRRDRPAGPGPCLLYGYGSYGASMDAGFNSSAVSLLDRGFVYAIAHVRGGQELGRAWYEAGKLRHKTNTFTDFIACAEHLIAEDVTSKDQLFALGGSAGGLLIGAVANMRPDLFHGLIAAVPFVDVVTTMLDETIPLTTSEYDEWGNPNEKDAYEWMLAYSPYDQVTDAEYPHLLVTTGYHDSQVQYFEPAKWVAKLRDHWQGDNRLLFDCEMEAGHGGVSGRYSRLEKTAEMYAFMLSLL